MFDMGTGLPRPSKTHKDYVSGWNSVVTALSDVGADAMTACLKCEKFFDAAQRGLLQSKNLEACHGVIDCVSEYERTARVPKPKG